MEKCKKRIKRKKYYTNNLFLQNRKKNETEIIAFFVTTFEPIKIQTCSAPLNDRLNLSFVMNINGGTEKLTRSGLKTPIYHSQIFLHNFF